MRIRSHSQSVLAILLFVLAIVSCLYAGESAAKKESSLVPVVQTSDASAMRVEGEKRFHANCGRCHAAPQKFSPRMMATVLRHMRVRATVTAEDQKVILFYLTQ